MGSLAYLSGTKHLLAKEIHTVESMFMQLGIYRRGGLLDSIETNFMFMEEIKAKQYEDGDLYEPTSNIAICKSQGTTLDVDAVLKYNGRICVPRVDDLILVFDESSWLTLFYSSGRNKYV